MIDMCFLLFSSFSSLDASKTLRKQSTSLFAGLERPHDSFGQPKAPKSGVAPAHPSVLPASKLNVAPCATSTLPITSRHPRGDANRDAKGDLCLSCTRHRFQKPQRVENRADLPERCRRTQPGPPSVGKTLLASPARQVPRSARPGRGSRISPHENAGAPHSGIQGRPSQESHTRGCPTSFGSGSNGGFRSTHPTPKSRLRWRGRTPPPSS